MGRRKMTTRDTLSTIARLPKIAQEIFQDYAAQASKGYAHALDWGAFYDFVIHCHQYRVCLSADEIKALLLARGFAAEVASELAEVYDHGRSLLARRISFVQGYRAGRRVERLAALEVAQNSSLHRAPRTVSAEATESGDGAARALVQGSDGRRR